MIPKGKNKAESIWSVDSGYASNTLEEDEGSHVHTLEPKYPNWVIADPARPSFLRASPAAKSRPHHFNRTPTRVLVISSKSGSKISYACKGQTPRLHRSPPNSTCSQQKWTLVVMSNKRLVLRKNAFYAGSGTLLILGRT